MYTALFYDIHHIILPSIGQQYDITIYTISYYYMCLSYTTVYTTSYYYIYNIIITT